MPARKKHPGGGLRQFRALGTDVSYVFFYNCILDKRVLLQRGALVASLGSLNMPASKKHLGGGLRELRAFASDLSSDSFSSIYLADHSCCGLF
jgi:hypothetical protein